MDNYQSELQAKRLWMPVYFAWSLTLTSILGSLFFSEVMKLPPCVLCWYQRIALYPLVIIFTVGIWTRDQKMARYAWPFVGIGLLTAIYHNLLYYQVISESISPCTQGVSCTEHQIEWFGILSIPLLSFFCFVFIAIFLVFFKLRLEEGESYEVR